MYSDEDALTDLQLGNDFPYDAPDFWWVDNTIQPVPPVLDWAHWVARGIAQSLQGWGFIPDDYFEVKEETRIEFVLSIATIIRQAIKDRTDEI